jgi:vacuolar-type H+-ATPase subunit I/STV1
MNKYILINKRNEGKPCGIYEKFIYAFNNMIENIINDVACLNNYSDCITNNHYDDIYKNYYIYHMIDNSNINCDIYVLEYINYEFKLTSQFSFNDDEIHLYNNTINLKLELLNSKYQGLFDDNESINCFIPKNLLKTENDLPTCADDIDKLYSINNFDINDVREKIEQLEKQKKNKEFELNMTEQELNEKLQEYTGEKMVLDEKKKILKEDQEKWNEFKRKFEVDKNLYFTFKDEMINGERKNDEIPELFKVQYKIFSKLDCENILNTENELNDYIDLMPMEKKNNLNFMPKEDSHKSLFDDKDNFLERLNK